MEGGLRASWSYKAVNIGRVRVVGRPALFDRASVCTKSSRVDRMRRTVRLDHSAILAINYRHLKVLCHLVQ
jgi:hypothetical protein